MALVKRDSFARTEIHRELIHNPAGTCSWCGGLNRAGKLFRYWSESDAGRKSDINGQFCTTSCFKSYHN